MAKKLEVLSRPRMLAEKQALALLAGGLRTATRRRSDLGVISGEGDGTEGLMGSHTIEIQLKSAEQIFNSLDRSPFHDRDLDEKAERFIVGWAREVKSSEHLELVVTLTDAEELSETARHIPGAIHNYFGYRALQSRQDLRELFRVGQVSLAIGLGILILCFGGIRYLSQLQTQAATVWLLEESLLILGWVANWRPLEIFLYDWWPIRRQVSLFARLAAMKVDVRVLPARI
jgi:hypothetical protein